MVSGQGIPRSKHLGDLPGEIDAHRVVGGGGCDGDVSEHQADTFAPNAGISKASDQSTYREELF